MQKFSLKNGCINGSISNGTRDLVLFTFTLDKTARHIIFCEPNQFI